MDRNPSFGRLFAIGACLLLAWPAAASGAPQARNAQECTLAADMAIVARALAEERLDPGRAETVMRRIYDLSLAADREELMRAILDAAYREREPAGRFATRLFGVCMLERGNMDRVLGTRL
jgi:hypothetical protein